MAPHSCSSFGSSNRVSADPMEIPAQRHTFRNRPLIERLLRLLRRVLPNSKVEGQSLAKTHALTRVRTTVHMASRADAVGGSWSMIRTITGFLPKTEVTITKIYVVLYKDRFCTVPAVMWPLQLLPCDCLSWLFQGTSISTLYGVHPITCINKQGSTDNYGGEVGRGMGRG